MPLWPSDWFSRSSWCRWPQVQLRRRSRDSRRVSSSRASRIASARIVSRSSTTLSVSRVVPPRAVRAARSRLLTTAIQRSPPSGHSDSRQLVVEGQPEQVAPDHVEVRRGGGVRGLPVVPVQRAAAGRRRSTAEVSSWRSRYGTSTGRHRVAGVELDLRHVGDARLPTRRGCARGQQVADPLAAVAVVPASR